MASELVYNRGECMTLHVLIPCSKTKEYAPSEELIWSSKKELKYWTKAWNDSTLKKPASAMYTGRLVQKQIKFCLENENVKLYIISAGGGLIYPVSKEIPAYEATFLEGAGPSAKDWHLLPEGGLDKIDLSEGDKIVTFAPPAYHRVLLHDPLFPDLAPYFVVGSHSVLAKAAGSVCKVHERTKEILKTSSRDMNSELLKQFLQKGENGLKEIYSNYLVLPVKKKRRKVDDEELYNVVLNSPKEIHKSTTEMVKYIRHECNISAIDTRIREALLKVREAK
jgi:hypothetical protein